MYVAYRRPPPVPPAAGWAHGPVYLAIFGVMMCLTISGNLLVSLGIPYAIPSGPFAAKLHPGSYAILAAFLALLIRGNPFTVLVESYRRQRACVLFAGSVILMLTYSLISFGPSGAAFLIDTLLVPALLAIIFDQARDMERRRLFIFIVLIMTVNAVIGLGESLLQERLVPYLRGDKLMNEDIFRSTALSGHPLANALRTLVVMLCLPVMTGRRRMVPLLILFALSMLAFGSRTGLALSIALLGLWLQRRFRSDLATKGFQPRQHGGGLLALILALALAAGATLFTNLGQRIFAQLYVDDSATARFLIFKVFDLLSPADIWLGIGPQKIELILYFLKRTTTITDIENIWILFIMQFGLFLTVLFTVTFACFLMALVRGQKQEVHLAMIAFVVFTLSNNSLASKSQDLVLVVAAMLGARGWTVTDPWIRRRKALLRFQEIGA